MKSEDDLVHEALVSGPAKIPEVGAVGQRKRSQ